MKNAQVVEFQYEDIKRSREEIFIINAKILALMLLKIVEAETRE